MHRNTLAKWVDVFGAERVLPVVFEKSISSVRAFFTRASIAVNFEGYEEPYPNRAISPFGMSVLRHVKQFARSEDELPELITEAHNTLKSYFLDDSRNADPVHLISLHQREKIMEHYVESNDWVRKNYFPERITLFPPLEHEEGIIRLDLSEGKELAEQIVRAARDRLTANVR